MIQIIINILKNTPNIGDNIGDNIRANIRANIWANIWDNIGDNIGDNIRDNIRDNIGDNIWDNIGDNIWANIRDNIWDNIWANIRDNIRDNIWDNKMQYEPFSYYCNVSDFGWAAFYDYFKRLNYFKFNWSDFINIQDFLKSGIYDFVAFKEIIFVSSCPVEIHQDTNNRLHSVNGASVIFKDGYKVHAVHGRILPSWIWEKKDKITKEMFLTEKNAEIRGAMYTILGEKRIMELLDTIEVDKQVIQHANEDIEIVKLYKTRESFPEIDNKPFAWVKFICPSTGSDYLIACEPHHTDAKVAAASLSLFKPEEYSFDFRT
jgi:hypothetical protein